MEEISCFDNIDPSELNTDTLIESTGGLSVAVERCPLCSEANRPFYCKRCVEKGRFIHSNTTYPESYDALQRKWYLTKVVRDSVLQRFKTRTAHLQRKDEKTSEIECCRRNIDLLKKSIEATKQLANKEKSSHDQVRRDNLKRHEKGKKHREKKQRILDYIIKVSDVVTKKRERLAELEDDLINVRQKHIIALTSYIFPVTEVKSKGDSMTMCGSDDVHVREALQDASSTAYVRGRWIYSNSQYRIVMPALPSHGEYTQYNIMVARAAEDGALDTMSPTSAGNTIIAGLCYTSQFVSLLSHILNISLPKKQCYSDFCVNDLSEKQFNRAVSRLNKNVLYLCFSQGVDIENIEPKHTLHNVVLLLTHTKLGRIGSFAVEQDMMDSVDDSNDHSEDSDDDVNNCYMAEPDPRDWETVPDHILVPASQQAMGYVSQDMTDSASLSASGVISSAFSTISSYFKR